MPAIKTNYRNLSIGNILCHPYNSAIATNSNNTFYIISYSNLCF